MRLQGQYRATVVRATQPGRCEYYPIPLSRPLPQLKIPLRPADADVILDLQPIFDAAYINGGYADTIDYTKSPDLPLPKDIEQWTSDWRSRPENVSKATPTDRT